MQPPSCSRYFLVRELAQQAKLSGANSVLINMANPGSCKPTTLFDTAPIALRCVMQVLSLFLERTAYVGALTLIATVEAGPESYGQYLESGEVSTLSPYVITNEGAEMQKKVWAGLMEILDGVELGVTQSI